MLGRVSVLGRDQMRLHDAWAVQRMARCIVHMASELLELGGIARCIAWCILQDAVHRAVHRTAHRRVHCIGHMASQVLVLGGIMLIDWPWRAREWHLPGRTHVEMGVPYEDIR